MCACRWRGGEWFSLTPVVKTNLHQYIGEYDIVKYDSWRTVIGVTSVLVMSF